MERLEKDCRDQESLNVHLKETLEVTPLLPQGRSYLM